MVLYSLAGWKTFFLIIKELKSTRLFIATNISTKERVYLRLENLKSWEGQERPCNPNSYRNNYISRRQSSSLYLNISNDRDLIILSLPPSDVLLRKSLHSGMKYISTITSTHCLSSSAIQMISLHPLA